MDLEEVLQNPPIACYLGIEDDLVGLSMGAVIAVGRIRHVPAGISDAGLNDAGQLADQVLNAPEATTSQNGFLGHLGALIHEGPSMELAEDSVVEANPVHPIEPATSAMTDDTRPPFSFPAVRGKKLSAAFDGGRVSSDGGVMLLAAAARRMRIAEKLAAVIPNRRDPSRVVHSVVEADLSTPSSRPHPP